MKLRTPAMEAKYQKAIKAGKLKNLWEVEPFVEWRFFKLIINDFPHDDALLHHLIVLKRTSMKLRFWEVLELHRIKKQLDDTYDHFLKNGSSMRSINNCYHEHVKVLKGKK